MGHEALASIREDDMGEAKTGEAFVKHEFDEAIAIQQVIVDAETKLSSDASHGQRQAHHQGSARRR